MQDFLIRCSFLPYNLPIYFLFIHSKYLFVLFRVAL